MPKSAIHSVLCISFRNIPHSFEYGLFLFHTISPIWRLHYVVSPIRGLVILSPMLKNVKEKNIFRRKTSVLLSSTYFEHCGEYNQCQLEMHPNFHRPCCQLSARSHSDLLDWLCLRFANSSNSGTKCMQMIDLLVHYFVIQHKKFVHYSHLEHSELHLQNIKKTFFHSIGIIGKAHLCEIFLNTAHGQRVPYHRQTTY